MAEGRADPNSVSQVIRARPQMVFMVNRDSCAGDGSVSVLDVIWDPSLNSSMERGKNEYKAYQITPPPLDFVPFPLLPNEPF